MTAPELHQLFTVDDLAVATVKTAPAPLLLSAHEDTARSAFDPRIAQAILAELRQRGALLLRGLGRTDASSVTQLADLLFAGEAIFGTGEHPHVAGETLYRPVTFAPEETLLWHQENSFNRTWPRFILFACAIPAAEGGATTIVDSRLVHTQMPDAVIASFAEHGISYTRVCDGRAGRSWEQIYETSDPDEAYRLARASGEVLSIAGSVAQISADRKAFLATKHGTSWFNQLLHWHPQALPADIRALINRGLMPAFRSCKLGNGEEITPEVVDDLVEISRSLEFPVRWQPGDVLLLNNEVFAHGRQPYHGRREHFVRMAGVGSHPPGA